MHLLTKCGCIRGCRYWCGPVYFLHYTSYLCLQTLEKTAFESLSRDFSSCGSFSNEFVSRSVKNKSRKRKITQKTTQPEKKKPLKTFSDVTPLAPMILLLKVPRLTMARWKLKLVEREMWFRAHFISVCNGVWKLISQPFCQLELHCCHGCLAGKSSEKLPAWRENAFQMELCGEFEFYEHIWIVSHHCETLNIWFYFPFKVYFAFSMQDWWQTGVCLFLLWYTQRKQCKRSHLRSFNGNIKCLEVI